MAPANVNDASTRSVGITLGAMYSTIVLSPLHPTALADSTYGMLRTWIALLRMTRADRQAVGIVKAMITFDSDGPKATTSASARIRPGNAIAESSKRMAMRSAQRP